jgi:predicted Rossmann fold nucleotide-binding protein DprA/Smf involved in DNA uptake
MKEFEMILKTFSACLKSMSQGFEAMAKMVDTFLISEGEKKPEEKTAAEPGPEAVPVSAPEAPVKPVMEKAKTIAAKKGAPPKEKPVTATDAIVKIISRSKEGVDTSTLVKETGFDAKKIHNLVYKLKKQGKIKSEKKGVYEKV